jgi:predicted Rossmann-fold nucleotide-binding protein
MVNEGFLKASNRHMLLMDEDIANLLDKMRAYIAPEVPKWITKQTT